MADQKDTPQALVAPEGIDDFIADQDPQAAIAAQGWGQLGQIAQPMVQQGLNNLAQTNQLAVQAANGDPVAAQAMAERSANAVAGSIDMGGGAIGRIQQKLGIKPGAIGYNDKVQAAKDLLMQAQEGLKGGLLDHTDVAFAMQHLKTAEKLSNRNKFAEGGVVGDSIDSFLNTVPQVAVAKHLLNDGLANSMPNPNEQEPGLQAPLVDPLDLVVGAAPSVADAIASGMAAKEFRSIVGNEIGAVGKNVKKVAKELPMDEASRLARAKEMGFDTSKTYYHGTAADFKQFKTSKSPNGAMLGQGTYLTEDPEYAAKYAAQNPQSSLEDPSGGNILPVHTNVKNPFDLRAKASPQIIEALKNEPGIDLDLIKHLHKEGKDNGDVLAAMQGNRLPYWRQTQILQDAGHDAVKDDQILNVFEPHNIRSKFAEFDTAKKDKSQLSFAKGGTVPQASGMYAKVPKLPVSGLPVSAPEGLDSFLASGTNTPSNTPNSGSSEPEGLDSFIQPEMQQAQYGTMGQQAIAGLEGAAQGLVGPLAPMAERGLGVDPEAIRGRAEANPMTHYGSEIAGLAGPALVTGGGSVAGKGILAGLAKFTQAGVLEAVAKKILPEAGTTLASRIGIPAAKAALDNMLISGSDETSKMILNDPNQTAESAIANVGLSGALGGVLGGAVGSVSPLWNKAFGGKTSKLIEDFKGRIAEHVSTPDPVDAVSHELGDYYTKIKALGDDVYGPTGLKAQDIAKAMPEMGVKIADQAQSVYDSAHKTLGKMIEKPQLFPPRLAEKLKGDLDAYSTALSKDNVSSSDVFNAMQDLKQSLQGYSKYDKFVKPVDEAYDFVRTSKSLAHELRTSLEDTGVWGKAAERQNAINGAFSEYLPSLKDFEKKFTTELAGERVIDPGKINTYINQNGKATAEIKQANLRNFLDASEKYKKVIGETHSNLGMENPVQDAPLNATLNTLKESTLGGKLADAFIEKGLHAGGAGTLGGSAGAAIGGALAGVHGAGIGAIIGHHALSPFFNSILPALAKSILGNSTNPEALKAAVDLSVHVAKADSIMTKAIKNIMKGSSEVLPSAMFPSEQSLDKLDRMVKKVAENPDVLLNQKADTAHYMPDATQAIDASKAQAAMYLNTLRPDVSKGAPLDSTPEASPVAKARYKNALEIAESPSIVLQKISKGTLTQNDITDLGTMYPALYNGMKSKLMDQVITAKSKGDVIPYKTRISLSMFMATPLDSTMTPSSIQTTQLQTGAGAQKPDELQQSPQGVKSSPALQKMGQMYQTPNQTRLSRNQKP